MVAIFVQKLTSTQIYFDVHLKEFGIKLIKYLKHRCNSVFFFFSINSFKPKTLQENILFLFIFLLHKKELGLIKIRTDKSERA